MDQHKFSSLEDIDLNADGSLVLRIIISVVYSVVCAMGLVGNLLVFFLMKIRQGRKKSTINVFVIHLAVTDFQFVLTLPFWAVDTVLDFSWPFGNAMCKIILSVTVMNMYASVFFLTAMSITRYWSVASALKIPSRKRSASVKWICAVMWILATIATAPTTIFSTVTVVAGLFDKGPLKITKGGDLMSPNLSPWWSSPFLFAGCQTTPSPFGASW
ncbi:relaxin-3 receptor 1 [Triplophysa dalaica]|uniref:relaxin-3 receptor 1 n=1 Tax=Triplophysa dalaica TaxID=1582913 RepID=UPI0024DF30CB|nr:relaxin-3 receptor 1 [Triplophysa dalaica]